MVTMDEYIEQLLAEMPESALHDVVKNIQDEPIPEICERALAEAPAASEISTFPSTTQGKREEKEGHWKGIWPYSPPQGWDPGLVCGEQDGRTHLPGRHHGRLGNFLRGWQLDVPRGHPQGTDLRAFLVEVEHLISKKLGEELRALGGGLKFQLALKVDLVKVNPDGSEGIHRSCSTPQTGGRPPEKWDHSSPPTSGSQGCWKTLEKWTQRGSDWAVVQVHTLWLDIARYQPLRGGSYIPLPKKLQDKKAVVNVKNDHCLRWALRSALFQAAKDPQRPRQIPDWRWPRLHRHRGPHTHLSDRHGGAPEQPRHQRVWLGQGGDRTPPQQATRRHAQDQSAVDWEGRQISLHLDQEPQPPPLWPEQTQREEALLRVLSPWLFQGRPAGGPQVRMSGNRPDGCQGGDARGGQEQVHFPEPSQAAAGPLYHLRRLWSPHHESRRARAWPHQKQHPEDTTPRGMQLLLCQVATDRQRRLSNTGGPTQQNTSSELFKRRSVGLRECYRTPKPC